MFDQDNRIRQGSYKAPPVRRCHIPKGKAKTRPIGIPTFEDKLLQRAVCMILTAIYEHDFLGCSHGFRPKRSPHTALEALRSILMNQGGGWIYEVDLRSYFDTINHKHLRSFLDQRVRDGILRKLIHKWLIGSRLLS
ncbi:reverse transcriptase domain-containing protein [candidate division CSSED10-310 bacterium]|uniref:Reverse transcriptase domain-containing protein n=1 Tax=candidate division CSSED10-310 bacterium TaxID=2855610 RepID=A0ABV6YX28_UNCC1